ncbi:MAG: hypothetical protein LBU87_04235 [Lactobacillales bacterium]|nr:hypothetical protein [Lactobacillales bacterium]
MNVCDELDDLELYLTLESEDLGIENDWQDIMLLEELIDVFARAYDLKKKEEKFCLLS